MSIITCVKDLSFSDLYLGHPSLGNRYAAAPGAESEPLPDHPALQIDLDSLLAICRRTFAEASSASVLRIRYDGESYRVSVMKTMEGPVFVLRRVAGSILPFAELGLPQVYLPALMRKDLSGLLLISGPPKSGKTMTACSLIRARLQQHGGVAVTGENPVELPLEGRHGKGVCYQTMMPYSRLAFGDAFQDLLRIGTRTIFIDEVRDEHAAAQLLQESVNGHLVVTTMLAENLAQAITKLESLAQRLLGLSSTRSLLADGLTAVLHQRFMPGPRQRIEAELLNVRGAPLMKTILRGGKHEMLGADVRKQSNNLISESAFTRRFAAV